MEKEGRNRPGACATLGAVEGRLGSLEYDMFEEKCKKRIS
jgi:hypothetical protein